jgi:hypothetical protein
VDWIIGRWTARRKERRSWRHAVSRLPELAPSKFTMDFVGPVICLPPGRPPRFIMTAGLKDGGKVSNSFTDFVGPLAPAFIAPLAREFRLTFEFIAPASVCKSSVDSGPAIASLSMTGRWKDGGKELNLFADFVGPLSNASIPAPLARVPRSRSHRPCNASRLSTWRRSRISRRPCHEVSSSQLQRCRTVPPRASIAEPSRVTKSSQNPRYDDLESEVGLDWPRQVLPRLYTTPPKILYE